MTAAGGRTYFVTGTDTDVGKTVATVWLASALAPGHRVALVKPVQTGASDPAVDGDEGFYRRALGPLAARVTLTTLESLPEPLAPSIAAARAGAARRRRRARRALPRHRCRARSHAGRGRGRAAGHARRDTGRRHGHGRPRRGARRAAGGGDPAGAGHAQPHAAHGRGSRAARAARRAADLQRLPGRAGSGRAGEPALPAPPLPAAAAARAGPRGPSTRAKGSRRCARGCSASRRRCCAGSRCRTRLREARPGDGRGVVAASRRLQGRECCTTSTIVREIVVTCMMSAACRRGRDADRPAARRRGA